MGKAEADPAAKAVAIRSVIVFLSSSAKAEVMFIIARPIGFVVSKDSETEMNFTAARSSFFIFLPSRRP